MVVTHSWIPSKTTACTQCHPSVPADGWIAGLEDNLHALEDILENVVGWAYEYTVDENGDVLEDENGDPIKVLDANGDPVILEVTPVFFTADIQSMDHLAKALRPH